MNQTKNLYHEKFKTIILKDYNITILYAKISLIILQYNVIKFMFNYIIKIFFSNKLHFLSILEKRNLNYVKFKQIWRSLSIKNQNLRFKLKLKY